MSIIRFIFGILIVGLIVIGLIEQFPIIGITLVTILIIVGFFKFMKTKGADIKAIDKRDKEFKYNNLLKELPLEFAKLSKKLEQTFNFKFRELDKDTNKLIFSYRNSEQNQLDFNKLDNFLEEEGLSSGYELFRGKNEMDFDTLMNLVEIYFEKLDFKVLNDVDRRLVILPNEIGIKNARGRSPHLIAFEIVNGKKHITYKFLKGIDNRAMWNSKANLIKDYLESSIVIDIDDENSKVLIKEVAKLDTIDNLSKLDYKNYLKEDEIFFGFGIEGPIYTPIEKMTHLLLTGESGSGKSVHFQMVNQSLLYNINKIEKIYYCDLKGGLEFSKFNTLKDSRIQVVGEHKELIPVVLDIELEMDSRMRYMRDNGLSNMTDNFVFFIIDEYAEVNGIMNAKGVSRKEAQNTLSTINRLAALGRAMGIRLYLQTQFGGADSIDTTMRGNLQSRILMRTKSRSHQGVVINSEFIDEINENPAEFNTGKFIYLDGSKNTTVLGQAIFTEPMNDYKNFKESYSMGQNLSGTKNLEESLNLYKIQILKEHIEDLDMDEKIKSHYKLILSKLDINAENKQVEENLSIEEKPKRKLFKNMDRIKEEIKLNLQNEDN